MTIAAILALIDGGPGSEGALVTATQVGRAFDAYVEVLHVRVDPETVIPVVAEGMSGAAIGQIMESTRQGAEQRAKEAERIFADLTASEGLPVISAEQDPEAGRFAVAWTDITGREATETAVRGRLFDLTVVARPEDEGAAGGIATLEAALFDTGRPLLVAPPSAASKPPRHVALAWNGTREAARAVWSARPFFAVAERISVITVLQDGWEANPVELATYLGRHGFSAETHLLKLGDVEVGERLLASAGQLGADLLVMGGYGHSRLRELVLGGATRSVLEQASLPILMAH
ncbi:MAG: universal stress protein [Kiloniellales bacterium]|nr:universal stress protein [Kiloniellales bacterium]